MGTIVRGFVVGTLGLAVLVGSPALSLAQPILRPRQAECQCPCWYVDDHGKGQKGVLTLPPRPNGPICAYENPGHPIQCKDNAGKVHQGKSTFDCKFIPGITAPIGPAQRAP
jgi:hypothetical protein